MDAQKAALSATLAPEELHEAMVVDVRLDETHFAVAVRKPQDASGRMEKGSFGCVMMKGPCYGYRKDKYMVDSLIGKNPSLFRRPFWRHRRTQKAWRGL